MMTATPQMITAVRMKPMSGPPDVLQPAVEGLLDGDRHDDAADGGDQCEQQRHR